MQLDSELNKQVELIHESVVEWSKDQAKEWVKMTANDPNALTCDELMEPLEMTGGDVCLKVEWKNSDEPWYYTVRSHTELNILLHHHDETIDAAHEKAETRLKQDRTHTFSTISAVQREDTPFEEAW
jgi:hypothetical protein